MTSSSTATDTRLTPHAIGVGMDRLDGPAKVTGTAPYAAEHHLDRPAYLHPLQATIARGRVTGIDATAAAQQPGVLAVLTHENAMPVASDADPELAILQSDEIAFRGQLLGGVIAETPEVASAAASLVRLEYEPFRHDVELRVDRDDLYAPDVVNPSFPTDTATGDVEAAMASASITVRQQYTTALMHNNPLEPHATIAVWADEADEAKRSSTTGAVLTLYDSTQGVHWVRQAVAPVLGLDEDRIRVICPHVGGGFGSKGVAHAHVILAAMAARLVPGRPVKLVLTRQQMFSLVGYRTPTIQTIQLGASAEGYLSAISNDVVEQTSRFKQFAEQTGVPTRMMYAAPNRRTTHRLAALDVPVPTWMRAPGKCPGMFGPEVAVDEMALACGLDPVELRIRNEPEVDPESGRPFSSRGLVACLRDGARRFGWDARDPLAGMNQQNRWWVGTGVAASTYPVNRMPSSSATIRVEPDGRHVVRIGAADIGTGTWTTLTQIAADALGVGVEQVELHIGDTELPQASGAGGSSGITTWGSTIVETARALRARLAEHPQGVPRGGLEVRGLLPDNPYTQRYAMHGFGAQFAEVRVHADTGEVRVPRLLGVFAVGRIINPKTGRSQLLGGMTMGLSMALHEDSVLDARFGHVVNDDFAEYHIASSADVGHVEVDWIDEDDPYVNPMGSKGIGEIGICGTAAAVANAAYHATGVRARDLPVTLKKFLR